MRRFSVLVALLLVPSALRAADALGKLIDKEQKEKAAWTETDGDLPPAYLWGNSSAVEIYNPLDQLKTGNPLCQQVPFDQLIDLSSGSASANEIVINTDLPRVRALLEDTCLTRPGDTMIAIGEGRQVPAKLDKLIVKREPQLCPTQEPYSLWAGIKHDLQGWVLFLTTDDTVKEGDNQWRLLTEERAQPDTALKNWFEANVKNLTDFSAFQIPMGAPNCSDLFVFRRRSVTPDDDKLPNEIIVTLRDKTYETVWMERVDQANGSGSLQVHSALDFNKDGFVDFIVYGSHQKCPYQMVFKGTPTGFEALDLPIKSCACN